MAVSESLFIVYLLFTHMVVIPVWDTGCMVLLVKMQALHLNIIEYSNVFYHNFFWFIKFWLKIKTTSVFLHVKCLLAFLIFFIVIKLYIFNSSSSFLSFFFSVFLGPHPWHMEVPRIGVQLELLPLAYATDTAMQDLSHVCNLPNSSQQCRILNPLKEARDRTRDLLDASWVC